MHDDFQSRCASSHPISKDQVSNGEADQWVTSQSLRPSFTCLSGVLLPELAFMFLDWWSH